MSLEPKTSAKVVITTNKGSIEVEIWAKELPLTSELFLSNCLNQKYNKNLLVTDEFIEIINEKEFNLPNESNSRISCKRGYLGTIKQGNKYSVDSFFISLTDLPKFQNYNIFGKIVEGWYDIVKISQGERDQEGNLLYPVKILKTEVIVPYFELKKDEEEKVVKNVVKQVNLNYEDDEEGEFKMKSAHKEIKEKPVEKEEEKEEQEQEESDDVTKNSDSESTYNLHPDPTIDSDYDSNLDLYESESITIEQLQQHKPI